MTVSLGGQVIAHDTYEQGSQPQADEVQREQKQGAGGAAMSRKLFWRFQANQQSAMREGDMKMLAIRGNTFLFNVVDDRLERANLALRQPEVLAKMVEGYRAWNATMLPEDPSAYSEHIYGRQWADHYGNEPDL